ncbi:hypothetical protein [Saccharibacillus deserti]|nr:hypothetical protein [Saccharibacillus deserti]
MLDKGFTAWKEAGFEVDDKQVIRVPSRLVLNELALEQAGFKSVRLYV